GEHKHDDWWCAEHGIPEDECTLCQATPNAKKVAKECKEKGDWCDKHDRAMSQCFICNPKRKDFYAAKFRAKYGKESPPIEETEKRSRWIVFGHSGDGRLQSGSRPSRSRTMPRPTLLLFVAL